MTKVAILPERDEQGEMTYRAVAGETETTGRTAGEALDALTSLLPEEETGTVVVQMLRPDVLFTSAQKQRLEELMARWRAARDAGTTIPPDEQRELDALVDAELRASTARASALAGMLGR